MAEREWLACTEPATMLAFLRGRLSGRKLRLFACAAARRVVPLLADERSRRAVEAAMEYADRRAAKSDLRLAWEQAGTACVELGRAGAPRPACNAARAAWSCARRRTPLAARDVATLVPQALAFDANPAGVWSSLRDSLFGNLFPSAGKLERDRTLRAEASALCELLREVAGSPFRNPRLEAAWRTPDATALARAVYEDEAFDQLPVLGDALEDAGCADPDLLGHCRQPAGHVRGCWVLDLVLRKR